MAVLVIPTDEELMIAMILYEKSGLLGLSETSGDMRELRWIERYSDPAELLADGGPHPGRILANSGSKDEGIETS